MALVKRVFPLRSGPWETLDPFHFVAYHADNYPVGSAAGGIADTKLLAGRNLGSDFSGKDGFSMYHGTEKNIPGFPRHPHYGFETVTIAEHGLVDHSDSLGSCGRFGNGDVQWMTAGDGVQHSEMFPLLDTENPNKAELFQIWLNLPSKSKRVPAFYKMLWSEDAAVVKTGPRTTVKYIADPAVIGSNPALNPPPNSWAADPSHHVTIHIVTIEEGGDYSLKAVTGSNVSRAVYFYKGTGKVALNDGSDLYTPKTGFELDAARDASFKAVSGTAHLLLMQGKQINEPSFHHGPFLGNTQTDVMEAMQRYRKTEYGGWPWGSDGPTHGKKGRFAKYVDGTVVEK